MREVATIILTRNLPRVANRLYEKFERQNNGETDVYVVESGTSRDQLCDYYTYWANWDEALKEGLRYPRGFNFGLLQLLREGKFHTYDYFLLVCNDVTFDAPLVPIMLDEIKRHPRVGILSPCSVHWAEYTTVPADQTRYVWHMNHIIWLVRRSFVETVMERVSPSHMNLLYDGSNFRGYCADLELIVKGYVNEYASAVTKRVFFEEDTSLLRDQSDLIRTDPLSINQRRVVEEGREWMHRKYGFTSMSQMQVYGRAFYDRFFDLYPMLEPHRY